MKKRNRFPIVRKGDAANARAERFDVCSSSFFARASFPLRLLTNRHTIFATTDIGARIRK
jgi:hypothetical protein